MLQNAYLLAKIGADTAENERDFAEILPKICNYPTDPIPYGGAGKKAGEALGASGLRRVKPLDAVKLVQDGGAAKEANDYFSRLVDE